MTITEKELTLLESKADKDWRAAVQSLKEATAKRKLAKEIAPLLPPAVANTSFWQFSKEGINKYYLETWMLPTDKADALVKELKIAGVQGFKATHKQFTDAWCYTGEIAVDAIIITIKVDGGSQPPSCRVEETREVREVTVYKAYCEETGEELK